MGKKDVSLDLQRQGRNLAKAWDAQVTSVKEELKFCAHCGQYATLGSVRLEGSDFVGWFWQCGECGRTWSWTVDKDPDPKPPQTANMFPLTSDDIPF